MTASAARHAGLIGRARHRAAGAAGPGASRGATVRDAMRSAPDRNVRPRWWWLHPLLAATFPVVFLFAANISEQITPEPLLGPLALAIFGAAILTAVVVVVLAAFGVDPARGALVATLLVVLFFAYGHVWQTVDETVRLHRFLLATWAALGLVGAALVLRVSCATVRAATAAFTVAGAALVAINVVPIVPLAVGQLAIGPADDPASQDEVPAPGSGRSIFYLVFDRYAGEPALEAIYGFDNRPFLEELERRGFVVASEATANYLKTAHSLASTLAMEYLDTEALAAEASSPDDWTPLYRALQGSHAVERFLHERGYSYVHLGVRRGATYMNTSADRTFLYGGHTEFAAVLMDTTLLAALENLGGDEPGGLGGIYGNATLYQFNVLEQLATARSDRPRFVFAHFLLPHPPYVFNADGSWVTSEQASARSGAQQYLEQLQYVNARVLGLLDILLEGPADERPIVLIQSDEGPFPDRYARDEEGFAWLEATDEELLQKFSILAAYHVPELAGREQLVYPEITPVNSFRLIFSEAFGADLPLLEDRNYVFVDQRRIYELVDITDRVP